MRELRLPTAVDRRSRVGLALGVSGLVFQTLLAQPARLARLRRRLLGREPVRGRRDRPASASASVGVSLAALVGALVSARLVYLLAWRDGISGYRFILIGIGVSEFMLSIVGYLLARADIYDAREAMTWLVGSVGSGRAGRAARVCSSPSPSCCRWRSLLDRPLRALELGDDAADGARRARRGSRGWR